MRHSHGLRAAAAGELELGDYYQGGYFAGYISHTADGNATHGLIVAPAASGYNNKTVVFWKTTASDSPGTDSTYDGAVNTANMATIDHPAAYYCANLSINGYTDWYLPALYELEIAYYNFKPGTVTNNTSYGVNSYAVPQRLSNYTSGDPAQTSIAAFQQTAGSEAFVENNHWSSTSIYSVSTASAINLNNGVSIDNYSKPNSFYVRAFRTFAL